MKASYDIVVIGAGPAGSVAAYAAARRGADVLLVDKATFPRVKVCGCCVNARAVSTLGSLGLGDVMQAVRARPLQGLRVFIGSGRAELALRGGFSASREAFDSALVERATAAGAVFRDRTVATVGPTTDGRRVVLLRSGGNESHVKAGVVIVADGLAGTALPTDNALRSRPSADSRMGAGLIVDDAPGYYEPGTIYMVGGPAGYVGLVRLEDGRLDIAAALRRDDTRRLGGPGRATHQLLSSAGLPAIPGLADRAWRGTPALTRRPERVHGERLFLLGDAAGYIEPFTGEGIAWAVGGAAALSDLALRAADRWRASIGRAWERRHRTVVRKRQLGCRAVAALMRRPRAAACAVSLLGRSPALGRPLVNLVTQAAHG